MNILEQEDIIKGLPDQALMQEAQMPSGQVPQYLVVSEIQRRSDMRKRFKEQQPQEGTVKDQVMQEGIMSMMPQMPPAMPMQASAPPMMPPSMPMMPQGAPPPMPPQGIAAAAPPQMMSGGGIVRMNQAGVVPRFGTAANPYFALMPYEAKEDFIRSELQSGKETPDLISSGITTQDIARFRAENPDFVDSEMSRRSFSQADPNSLYSTVIKDQVSDLISTPEERDAQRQARIAANLEAGSGLNPNAGANRRILPDFLAQGTDFNPFGFLPNYSGTNPVGDAISSAVPSFSVDGGNEDPLPVIPFTPTGSTLEEVAGSIYDYGKRSPLIPGPANPDPTTISERVRGLLGQDYSGFMPPLIAGGAARDRFIADAVASSPDALSQYLNTTYKTAGANVQGSSPVQRQSVDVGGAFDDLYKAMGIPTKSNTLSNPRMLSALGVRTRVTPDPDAVLRDAKAASARLDDLADTEPNVDDAGGVEQQIEKVVGQSPKGESSEFSAYLQTLQDAAGNDASAPKDEAATDPAVRPELDFKNLIEDSRRQAMSNALIQLGSGIAAGNVAGGISAAGEAAAAGTAAAREIDMKSRLAQYEAGRQDLMREEDRSEAALERKARAFESAQDRLLKARLSEEDRALERQRIKDQAAYQSGQLGVSRDKLEILSDQVENELKRLTYETDKANRVSASQLAEFVNSLVETQLDDEILEPGERARVARTLTENAFRRYSGLFDVDVSKIDFTPTSSENVAFDSLKTKSTR